MQGKTNKTFLVFEIIAFELLAGNCPDCDESTCNRQLAC